MLLCLMPNVKQLIRVADRNENYLSQYACTLFLMNKSYVDHRGENEHFKSDNKNQKQLVVKHVHFHHT